MLQKELRICIFGTSTVKQNNSIFDSFLQILNCESEDNNVKFLKLGYPSLTIYEAPCFIEEVIKFRPDIVILSWWDSAVIRHQNLLRLPLEAIIFRLFSEGVQIINFFHYRLDHDFLREEYFTEIESICNEYGIKNYHDKGNYNIPIDFRDIVHTTETGSEKIAIDFFNNFFKLLKFEKNIHKRLNYKLPVKNIYVEVKYKVLDSHDIIGNYILDENYFVIDKKSSIHLNTKYIYEIIGFDMKVGPFSPVILISKGISREYAILWDQWAYYEREYMTCRINVKNFDLINIVIYDAPIDYSICKVAFDGSSQKKMLKIKGFYYV